MKSHCIYGPPGTGKTTELMRLLNTVLERNRPSDVCFLSHTKAAAKEVIERAGAKIPPQNISTIHSLCFRLCDMSRNQVLDYNKLREFGRECGIMITGRRITADDGIEEGDEYLSVISFAENRKISDNGAYDLLGRPGRYDKFIAFCSEYRQWKQQYGLYDFDDMLKLLLETKVRSSARAIFVDESQDLSPLQWDVLSHILLSAKLSYVAGDDDQAIFIWGGAKADGMASFESEYGARRKILDRSYRIPRAVHKVANDIIKRVTKRVDKHYKPRSVAGVVRRIAGFNSLVLEPAQETLILYRDLGGKEDVIDHLHEHAVPYLTRTGFPGPLQNKFGKAIRAIREDGQINVVKKALSVEGERFLQQSGDSLEKLARLKIIDLLDLMDPMPTQLRWYYMDLDWDAEPVVSVSTIHGAKGHEADHVVLYNQMSGRTEESYIRNPDQEHRVWYVGATRAKEELTIVEGQGGYDI
jgi:DNA helicase-2/ATP-dependent DNA helicase PcrA